MIFISRQYLPRSIPMTWPFTFSSPPSVEFHLRNEAGSLEAGVRAKAARGSWERVESVTCDALIVREEGQAYCASNCARKHCDDKLINKKRKRETPAIQSWSIKRTEDAIEEMKIERWNRRERKKEIEIARRASARRTW